MLGENKPHPVALLAPGLQFRQRRFKYASRLGLHEALKIEWIAGHN